MGGGVAKRVLLAPIVIIVATTVVPPTTAAFSPLSHWLTKTVPPTLATVNSLNGWVTNGLPPRETTDSVADKPEAASEVTLTAPAASDAAPSAATASLSAQQNVNISETPERTDPSPTAQTEKPILASLGGSDPVIEARKSTIAPLPPEELEAADADTPGEPAANEKETIITLTSPATEAETPAPAASVPPVEELKVAGESRQAEDKQANANLEVASNDETGLSTAKQFPSSPALERRASLGPVARGNAQTVTVESSGYVPPEKSRVAYDAPVSVEEPTSIGKRAYVDDTVYTGLGKPEALLEALRYMGANAKTLGLPPSLWCADFMNMVLRKTGIEATGSRAARSYLKYGQKIDEPRVGAIAIFTRGENGGHIGIVRGTDGAGNPIIVSGNYNNRVAEAVYPKSRVLAYVVPYDKPH